MLSHQKKRPPIYLYLVFFACIFIFALLMGYLSSISTDQKQSLSSKAGNEDFILSPTPSPLILCPNKNVLSEAYYLYEKPQDDLLKETANIEPGAFPKIQVFDENVAGWVRINPLDQYPAQWIPSQVLGYRQTDPPPGTFASTKSVWKELKTGSWVYSVPKPAAEFKVFSGLYFPKSLNRGEMVVLDSRKGWIYVRSLIDPEAEPGWIPTSLMQPCAKPSYPPDPNYKYKIFYGRVRIRPHDFDRNLIRNVSITVFKIDNDINPLSYHLNLGNNWDSTSGYYYFNFDLDHLGLTQDQTVRIIARAETAERIYSGDPRELTITGNGQEEDFEIVIP